MPVAMPAFFRYCIVNVTSGGAKVGSKRTKTLDGAGANPVWKSPEAFSFSVAGHAAPPDVAVTCYDEDVSGTHSSKTCAAARRRCSSDGVPEAPSSPPGRLRVPMVLMFSSSCLRSFSHPCVCVSASGCELRPDRHDPDPSGCGGAGDRSHPGPPPRAIRPTRPSTHLSTFGLSEKGAGNTEIYTRKSVG